MKEKIHGSCVQTHSCNANHECIPACTYPPHLCDSGMHRRSAEWFQQIVNTKLNHISHSASWGGHWDAPHLLNHQVGWGIGGVVQFKKALGPMHVLGMHNLSQDGVIMNIFFCSLKAVIKADSDCQNEHFKSMPAKEEVLWLDWLIWCMCWPSVWALLRFCASLHGCNLFAVAFGSEIPLT